MPNVGIEVEQQGAMGHIRLTRPESLNALTLEMVRAMNRALREWQHDDSIDAVLVTGDGDRAFCAGGDVKRVYFSGKEDAGTHGQGVHGLHSADFFRQEYVPTCTEGGVLGLLCPPRLT